MILWPLAVAVLMFVLVQAIPPKKNHESAPPALPCSDEITQVHLGSIGGAACTTIEFKDGSSRSFCDRPPQL